MTTPYAEQLSDLHNRIGILEIQQTTLTLIIEDLEKKGILDGHAWYKNGKYLYLIHHADQHKEYIGADPEAQQNALARIERFAEWQESKRKLGRLKSRIAEIKSLVNRAWNLVIEE